MQRFCDGIIICYTTNSGICDVKISDQRKRMKYFQVFLRRKTHFYSAIIEKDCFHRQLYKKLESSEHCEIAIAMIFLRISFLTQNYTQKCANGGDNTIVLEFITYFAFPHFVQKKFEKH